MGMSYKTWRGIVGSHYGGLHVFEDATTVRFYYAEQAARLASVNTFAMELASFGIRSLYEEQKEYIEQEREESKAALEDLGAWLLERGLFPY